jgi:uncharacterized sodium:solute symporter family permease YidK
MAGNGGGGNGEGTKPDLVEERLRRRLRIVAAAVILVMVILIPLVDTFGRLFLDPTFRASELLYGTLMGALLLLLGLEGISLLPGLSKK